MAQNPYAGGAGTITPDLRPPEDYQHINAQPEAFGSAIARGEEQLGQGGVHFSHFYSQINADDAANQLFHRWNNRLYGDPSKMTPQPDGTMKPDVGYMGLKGYDAATARPGLMKDMDADLKEIRGNLSTFDELAKFEDYSHRYRQQIERHVGSHAEGQYMVWAQGVNSKTVPVALEPVRNNPLDDDVFNHAQAETINARVKNVELAGGGEVQRKAAILGAKQEALEARGSAIYNLVQRYVGDGDVDKAAQTFQRLEKGIDDNSANRIRNFLRPHVDALQVETMFRTGGYISSPQPDKAPSFYRVPSFSPQINSVIDDSARKYNVDAGMMRTFAKIESGGDPNAVAPNGSYHGLFQLSTDEYAKHGGQGNIYDAAKNADAAARKIAAESAVFRRDYGREPTAFDLYMVHQQGAGGYAAHMAHPDAPAWENMASTAEGRRKGSAWAQAAIWGNIPDKDKARFGNDVENVTSQAFMNLWKGRIAAVSAESSGKIHDRLLPSGQEITAPSGQQSSDQELPAGLTMTKSEAYRRAEEQTQGLPLRIRDKLFQRIDREFNRLKTEYAGERLGLSQSIPEIIHGTLLGNENMEFPDAAILRAYPEKYAQWREQYDQAKVLGPNLRAAIYASPQDVAEIAKDIGSGQGWRSELLKSHLKGIGSPDPDGDYSKMKATAAKYLDEIIKTRIKGMNDDPAGFVAGSQEVKEKAKALTAVPQNDQNGRMQAQLALWDASWKKQGDMGLAEEDRHIVDRNTAERVVSALQDPNVTPHALKGMQELQRAFGPQWGHAFKDLSTIGGLPSGYQSVMQLDAQNADLLARALREGTAKDNKEAFSWEKALGRTASQAATGNVKSVIDANIDNDHDKVRKFRDSLLAQGLSAQVADSHIHDIKTLAYAHAFYKGATPGDAAEVAKKAFLGDTEFYSGARVPADKWYQIRDAARAISGAIDEHSVSVPQVYSNPSAARESSYAAHASAALAWVNNRDNSGVLAVDHTGKIMHWKNGAPIEIKFGDPANWHPAAASATAPAPPPAAKGAATVKNPFAEGWQ